MVERRSQDGHPINAAQEATTSEPNQMGIHGPAIADL